MAYLCLPTTWRQSACYRERACGTRENCELYPLSEKSSNRVKQRDRESKPPTVGLFPECRNGFPLILWMSMHNFGGYAQKGSLKFCWLSVCLWAVLWGVRVTGACSELCQVLHGKVLGDQDITTDSWVERGYRDNAAAPGVEAEPQPIGVNFML